MPGGMEKSKASSGGTLRKLTFGSDDAKGILLGLEGMPGMAMALCQGMDLAALLPHLLC